MVAPAGDNFDLDAGSVFRDKKMAQQAQEKEKGLDLKKGAVRRIADQNLSSRPKLTELKTGSSISLR